MCRLILRKRWGEVLEKDGLPAFARGYGATGADRTDIRENDEERRPAKIQSNEIIPLIRACLAVLYAKAGWRRWVIRGQTSFSYSPVTAS
jgi:hypothetical protein